MIGSYFWRWKSVNLAVYWSVIYLVERDRRAQRQAANIARASMKKEIPALEAKAAPGTWLEMACTAARTKRNQDSLCLVVTVY